MAFLKTPLGAVVSTILAITPLVRAGFDSTSQTNIAVYWGQNSAGTATSQQRLSTYCSNSQIDVISIAFLDAISTPTVNFANAGDNCTAYTGTNLLNCPQIEEDIITCQSLGKTILLSIGGATYTEGGFSSSSAAQTAAQNVWNLFGTPTSSSNRPFGTAIVDGFDFDFESTTQNMAPFAEELRSLMDAASGTKDFYLSAAPQCPYPDAADNDMLDGAVYFDFVQVQFYNNYCGVSSYVAGATTQNNFNFDTWDTWAKTVSADPDVKVLLGVPANTGAGSGYVAASTVNTVTSFCKQYSSFGGVMMWDMSQLWANSGFLSTVYSGLTSSSGGSTTSTATKTTSTTVTTTLQTSTTTTSGASTTAVPQWGQCGGTGYTGSTVCQSPYTCVATSVWWSQCE